MSNNNGNAPVDVLAVLDLAACRERDAGMPDGVQIAARAAVAELIEAVRKIDSLFQPETIGYMESHMPDEQGIFAVNSAVITLGDLRRLHSALSRVQGDAA